MDITHALVGEHGVFYALFDHLEREAERADSIDTLRCLAASLADALIPHAQMEDELLFSALEPHIGPMGPLAMMRHEHSEVEGGLLALRDESDAGVVRNRLAHVIATARVHFKKEEQVLFPMARQHLDAKLLDELAQTWAARRGVALA